MKHRSRWLATLIFPACLSLLGTSCARRTPQDIPLPEFADLYGRLVLAAAATGTPDSTVVIRQDSLLRAHGYTREQFAHSLDRYLQDPQAWLTVTKRALALLDSAAQARATMERLRLPRHKPRAPRKRSASEARNKS